MTIFAYIFLFLFFMLFSSIHVSMHDSSSTYESTHQFKHYIVFMGKHSFPDFDSVIHSNHELLASYVGSVDEAHSNIVHHYYKSFRGFSARLTPDQANELKKHKSVVSVFESKVHKLQTTRSWDFMMEHTRDYAKGQFNRDRHNNKYDVIVGHFDGGVWPESKSFSAGNIDYVPSYFRGECVTGDEFTEANCNGKIVGARYYSRGWETEKGNLMYSGGLYYRSARDDFGHGSHTASIAVGNEVHNITVGGVSGLTAQGGAPNARIAVYKVCWYNYCTDMDIFKAFDDAVYDNVDIITMSIGQNPARHYLEDGLLVGSLYAYMNGILVVTSAGNEGEKGSSTVSNIAPWLLTVAASSIDREIISFVRLGNGVTLKGYGKNPYELDSFYPLVLASDAAGYGVFTSEASYCKQNTLSSEIISGKIVVCFMEGNGDNPVDKSRVVQAGGGVGMIVIDDTDIVENYAVAASAIGRQESEKLRSYMAQQDSPVARIFSRTYLRTKPTPKMASFSSKGPNPISPDIIKPDITAPGVNILAAWPAFGVNQRADALSYAFNSGTSMSCPHASGVAAVIKAFNRNWSPAAIKSALMTSAFTRDNSGNPIQAGHKPATPFDMGSGHLDPDHAINPGLIYDFCPGDIIDFLCSQLKNSEDFSKLRDILGMPVTCKYPPVPPYNLNYPSIGIGYMDRPMAVSRTVTFVGNGNDPLQYKASIQEPEGVYVEVNPMVLDFSNGQTTAQYTVEFRPYQALGYVFGSIVWSDGKKHNVRTPIALNVV